MYAFVKSAGRFVATNRTDGVSTSDLITRIVRDYDSYVRRNLERGVSAKDLNLSYFKFTELQVKNNMAKIANKITQTLQEKEKNLPETWKETFQYWEDKSQDFVRGFGNMFRRKSLKSETSSPERKSP